MDLVFLRTVILIFLAEMGDKSQLLLAALAAECRLRDLFLGSFAAITLLCGLAVSLGALLGDFLPMAAVSLIAGVAFLLFAWSGLREERADGKKRRRTTGAVAVFGTYFLAELGDKTQLSTLALAAEAPARGGAVFCGAVIALLLSGSVGIALGVCLGKRLPAEVFRALSFVLFAACGAVKCLDGAERLFSKPLAIGATVGVLFLFLLLCAVTVRREGEKRDAKRNESLSIQRQ